MLKQGIQKILRVDNIVTDNDLVIEECNEYSEALNTYKVILPRSKFSDMHYLISNIYKSHIEICDEVFESGSDSDIVQMCKIFTGGVCYTEQFIKLAGGCDNLISNNLDTISDADLVLNEEIEEDPELIKELEEKIKQMTEERERMLEEHESEIVTLKSQLDDANSYKELFKDAELDDDDLDLCLDVIESIDGDQAKDVIVNMLASRAGEGDEEESDTRILSLYIGDLVNALDEGGLLDG